MCIAFLSTKLRLWCSDVLVEKVSSNLVSPPNRYVQGDHDKAGRDSPEVLPSSHSIQTLRTQTVDFHDSKHYIRQAAAYGTRQGSFSYSKEGRLLDVTILRDTTRSTRKELEDEILILHVTGLHQNELAVIIPSAPQYTRGRHASTFADYSLHTSSGRVTKNILRQIDDEEAENSTRRHHNDDGLKDNLLSERFTLHAFPSKICSIEFGPETSPYGHFHTGPWLCIRTITSTLFATIGVSSRKERLQGYQRLRLVALLEIQHGNSLLSSGVTARTSKSSMLSCESVGVKHSKHPIVDVRFHPHRCTSAVTIDSRGNVGVFDCDFITVQESSWEKGITWSVKQASETEEAKQDSHSMIEWAEEEGIVVLANKSVIEALSLLDGSRRRIYTSSEGSIVSVTRSSEPNTALWVATSKDILLIDLRTESSFQAPLSWEHHCSHSDDILLSNVEGINNTSTVVISNRCNRLLSLYSASATSSVGPAVTTGEASELHTGLPWKESYATAPVFVKMAGLHSLWHRFVRRWSLTSERETEKDQLMIEMARDGSVWIKAVSWSIKPTMPSPALNRSIDRGPSQEEDKVIRQIALPEITAQRSLHSLGPVYRVLMGGTSADSLHGHTALSTIFKASRWLQEQDMPLETMLLPHDLLAMGQSDDVEVHTRRSILMQIPLLSMSMAVSPGVQRLLEQLLTTVETDAWTLDLTQLIGSQLCARVPAPDTMDQNSEKLSSLYLSQNTISRSVTADTEVLTRKMRDCCREIGWDLLLSSRVISMRPIVVQDLDDRNVETEEVEERTRAPPFTFSYFTPRLAMPSEASKLSASHQNIKTRKRIVTKSARWLLDEWKIGSDPKDYRFQHPYGDDYVSEQDASEDYRSQSESEQHRSSRDQSNSRRSMSAARLSEGLQQDTASTSSILIPPTVSSASQPIFAAPSHSSRRHVAQSQPVFASTRTAKPKKRRVGGF